ncbi:MAG TPA: hypothetical protein P5081_04515 [Phycisphaerae bacterium]|nr:hypothetical protein [Phycisphaerae bacterium]HRW52125.1 hypothetical protein [Phycisphaerae bacterium]
MNHPQCGNCGYDLTSAESNRCPECGRLFIEAGVRVAGVSSRGRVWRGAVLGLALLCGSIAGVVTYTCLNARAAKQLSVAQNLAATEQQRSIALQGELTELRVVVKDFRRNQGDLVRWFVRTIRAQGTTSAPSGDHPGAPTERGWAEIDSPFLQGLRAMALSLDEKTIEEMLGSGDQKPPVGAHGEENVAESP